MLTNVLLEHPWLSPAALLLMVIFGPVLGRGLVPRSSLAWLTTGVALLPVVVLTLCPSTVRSSNDARCS